MATIPSTDFAADEVKIGAWEDAMITVHNGSLRMLYSFLTDPLGNAGVFIRVHQVLIF
jgi:hypothetical protein